MEHDYLALLPYNRISNCYHPDQDEKTVFIVQQSSTDLVLGNM
jgi:hypothetical protein